MEWWWWTSSRPYDPCSILSCKHQCEFSLVYLFGKILFHVPLKVSWWDTIIFFFFFFLLQFGGIAWLVMLKNVGFGAFLKCCFFFFFYHGAILGNFGGLWNFDNVGTLWCCWMNFGLNFGSIGMVKNLCCRFGWICSWCMWEKSVGMCKLCFMDMKKLCE